MRTKAIRLLHLGTEYTWRGGENQARLLIDGLRGQVEEQFGGTPEKSVAYLEKRWNCELLGLHSGNAYDPIAISQLIKFCRRNRVSIIDAHTAKAHSLAINAAPFLPETKIVVHRRVDNVPQNNFFTRRKYFHKRVDHFTAISHFIREVLIKYGVPQSKISVARSAVRPEIYEKISRKNSKEILLGRYNLPAHHTLIGNASALTSQKGHETLIRAIKKLETKNSDFSVLIAGDGNQRESLLSLTRQLKLEKRICFTGFIHNVPEFLAGLDILAVPSNNEGLGTVILDGVLAGCAVIGSRVGGIPEIITHEKTGLLEEVGDYEKLADNLLALVQNPQMRDQLSQNAKAWVIQEFGLNAMVQGNLSVYKKVLELLP